MPAAVCRRRRVSGPKRSASHSASSWPPSAAPRANAGRLPSSGASSAIVVSRRQSRASSRCRRSFARGLRRASEAQELHFVDAREQVIEAAEMGQQDRRSLGADAGHAGDVVDRIAGEGEVVGHLGRMHALSRLDSVGTPALALGKIPLFVELAEQLRHVLVGRDDHPAMALAAGQVQGAADQVIGFVIAMGQHLQPERETQGLAVRELALEGLGGRISVGLVRRIECVAETGVECFVERHHDVPRAFAFQQLQQEAGKPMHGVGRPAVLVLELVRHRVPGPEHVQAGVDQVQRRPCSAHAGVQSLSSAVGSGRSRSGASSFGVPIWMKPVMRSSSPSPSSCRIAGS